MNMFEESKVSHPKAWAAFKKMMRGKKFGREETIQSWWDFLAGWQAAHARIAGVLF